MEEWRIEKTLRVREKMRKKMRVRRRVRTSLVSRRWVGEPD